MTGERDDEAAVRAVLEEVLDPLLQQAGAGAELAGLSADTVRIRLRGTAAFGPGAALLREDVVGAALAKVCGERTLAFETGPGTEGVSS